MREAHHSTSSIVRDPHLVGGEKVQSLPSESQESLDCSLGVGDSTRGMGSVAALRGAGGGRWVMMGSVLSSREAAGCAGASGMRGEPVARTCCKRASVRIMWTKES